MFNLFCPADPATWDQPMIMFHNGSMKDNFNIKTICPLKQKQNYARITYENGYLLYIYPSTGKLSMEELGWKSIHRALQRVGRNSMICSDWEIYKLLFILHNVNPDWIELDWISPENLHEVFLLYDSR